MKISELPEGLRQLAERRRRENKFETVREDDMYGAFIWAETAEGLDYWVKVHGGDFSVYHGCKVTNLKMKERQ
jgi:hypothetical protein